MRIVKCSICGKPFFPDPTTTGYAVAFDPDACSQCNDNARKNSAQVITDKTYSN